MADNKQTMYEILGVAQAAELPEIKAAHYRLTRELVSGNIDLPRDEINFRLQLLDLAFNTLSVQWSRDAYDAELAASAPSANRSLPALSTSPVSPSTSFNALQVAEALHETYKTAMMENEARNSLVVLAESAASSTTALKKIFRVLAFLLVMFIVLKGAMAVFMATHGSEMYASEKAKAEEKLIIQDYYQKHGVRPASRAEAEMLETEARRKEDDLKKAGLQQQMEEERDRQFAEESRRFQEQVAREREVADAQAQAEKERASREAEWAKQQAEEKARREEEIARQEGLERTRRDEALARERSEQGMWRQPTYPYQEQEPAYREQ